MIEGIIFDIDGTLIDSMIIWEKLGEKYLENQGIVPEEGLDDILFSMTIDEGVNYLKVHYDISASEDDIRDALINIIRDFYNNEVQLKAGVIEFLQNAKNNDIPMVLATAGDVELERAALVRLGIWEYFENIFTCEELHTSKREATIYLKAAEYINKEPNNILVIEDVYQAVHAAHQAGFKVAAIEDCSSIKDKSLILNEADYYGTFDNSWVK